MLWIDYAKAWIYYSAIAWLCRAESILRVQTTMLYIVYIVALCYIMFIEIKLTIALNLDEVCERNTIVGTHQVGRSLACSSFGPLSNSFQANQPPGSFKMGPRESRPFGPGHLQAS